MQEIDADKAVKLLKLLAVEERVLSYREFATQMNINKAPIIQTVTSYLERLTIEDINHGRPILASVIVKKNSSLIPRQGLLQLLQQLNVFSNKLDDEEILSWMTNERAKLKSYYLKGAQP